MPDQMEIKIGSRIKDLRKIRGLTLRSLAESCGLSANAISLIERGENSPTVSSLLRLATSLGVSINDLFRDSQKTSIVFVKSNDGMRIANASCEIKSLGHGFPNLQIEPYQITIHPGTDTSSKPISHPGQELIFCLSGGLEYFINDQSFKMSAGDSLLFDAMHPHGWCNRGTRDVIILMIFQSLSDPHLARQRHLGIA